MFNTILDFQSKKMTYIFLLTALIVITLCISMLVKEKAMLSMEGFSVLDMLNFSTKPTNKIPQAPLFGVGDNYSFQKEPERGKKYVKPDKATPTSLYYVNSDVKIWSPDTIREFLEFQARENPDVIFDMDIIQQQSTEEEAKQFLKNGKWSWSDRTKKIYADVMSRNNYTKKGPQKGIETDQTIYNERVMLQMLGLNEPEGQFLLHGRMIPEINNLNAHVNSGKGTYGINSGLIDPNHYKKRLHCEKNKIKLQEFIGYNKGITGAPIFRSNDVKPEDISKLYPEFQFINEPCDPCVSLDLPYNTKCPFSLKPNKKVSPAWETIWGLTETPIPELPKEFPYWMN